MADPDELRGGHLELMQGVDKSRKSWEDPTSLVQSVAIYGVSSCAKDI